MPARKPGDDAPADPTPQAAPPPAVSAVPQPSEDGVRVTLTYPQTIDDTDYKGGDTIAVDPYTAEQLKGVGLARDAAKEA